MKKKLRNAKDILEMYWSERANSLLEIVCFQWVVSSAKQQIGATQLHPVAIIFNIIKNIFI